jgi:UDP-N-acetyl-D-glucosamine/UDP-N-acetyl-D-galactosamine dehydrogenase
MSCKKDINSIAIIGLGYIGLPLAIAFSRKYQFVIGYDADKEKIFTLKNGLDPCNEGLDQEVKNTTCLFTNDDKDLAKATIFIIAVPTPISPNKEPDLYMLEQASKVIAKHIKVDDIVVLESTVYPGITEQFVAPIIESHSGLKAFSDFKLAYSPERMNPGDIEKSLTKVIKVVSAQDEETLEVISEIYSNIIEAGIYKSPSIKVAEATKLLENIQRDINIAIINEVAQAFDKLDIKTSEVIKAASTKWNFMSYSPGLVGGSCIGVVTHYLINQTQKLGLSSELLETGRKVNDNMSQFIICKVKSCLVESSQLNKNPKIGVLGLTFKENVSDIRNSKIPEIVNGLVKLGAQVTVVDPYADKQLAMKMYNIVLKEFNELETQDLLLLAVPHNTFIKELPDTMSLFLRKDGFFLDLKASLTSSQIIKQQYRYWSL